MLDCPLAESDSCVPVDARHALAWARATGSATARPRPRSRRPCGLTRPSWKSSSTRFWIASAFLRQRQSNLRHSLNKDRLVLPESARYWLELQRLHTAEWCGDGVAHDMQGRHSTSADPGWLTRQRVTTRFLVAGWSPQRSGGVGRIRPAYLLVHRKTFAELSDPVRPGPQLRSRE